MAIQTERGQTPIDTLQGLVRIPSYSGEEEPIQGHVFLAFTEAGLEPFFQDKNVIVHLKGKDPTRALIFNSHVDVVDVGDETRWEHEPWGGVVEDGRIYGRGTSDMKMGVAATIEVAKSLAERGDLPCDVWFTYVVKEEVDGAGTKSFSEWFRNNGYTEQYSEVAAVFTEPTDMDRAQYGHRGNFFVKAELDGDAGHASQPKNIKRHAIVEMLGFIDELQIESVVWEERFHGDEFIPPTITPTSIEAKSGSPNKVADHATATFDLRTIPVFHTEAFDRVRELAEKRGIKISLAYDESPTGYTEPNAEIIKALQRLVPNLTLEVSQASADLGFMTGLGAQGVIFGPGDKAQMHEINESAPVEHLEKAIDLYIQLIYEWGNTNETTEKCNMGTPQENRPLYSEGQLVELIDRPITQHAIEELITFDNLEFFQNADYTTTNPASHLKQEDLADSLARGDIINGIYDQTLRMVGYYWFETKDDALYIASLLVARDYRDRSIGKYFLQMADRIARERGLAKTALVVDPYNSRGVNAYLKHGYQVTEFRIVDGVDRLYMVRSLHAEPSYSDEGVEVLLGDRDALQDSLGRGLVGVSMRQDPNYDNGRNVLVLRRPST